MNVGDFIIFRKDLTDTKLTEGRLIAKSEVQIQTGEKPFWLVEFGKSVKKQILIHEAQIEGMR